MGKKPLVEDSLPKEGEELTLPPVETPLVIEPPAIDPTEVNGSIFPQVPGEEKGERELLLEEELIATSLSSTPTIEELGAAVSDILSVYSPSQRIEAIHTIEHIIKEHKSRM